MKKAILSGLMASFLLGGCMQQTPPASSNASFTAPSESPSQTESQPLVEEADPSSADDLQADDDDLFVADAAMYRGVVTTIETNDSGEMFFTLAQAEGTNFGYPTLEVTANKDTRTNLNGESLPNGAYVEIYYGAPTGEVEQPVTAIVIKKLLPVESVVLNGEIISVTETDSGTNLLVRRIGGENETIVRVGAETQIYMNEDDLVEGCRVNIFTNGIANPSMPPQVSALEIRLYAEPEA